MTPTKSAATKTGAIRFRTTILQAGKTATGIQIPDDVIAKLGTSKKPPVCVTLNGYTYRSTVAVMAGKFMVGVSAAVRAAAKVAGGDEVAVDIAVDEAPREVAVPLELRKALAANPKAKQCFDQLSYSKKRLYTVPIESAKTKETRQRNLDKAIAALTKEAS
jgi:Bacteriocin-protection, YdeI or OmpD-Associated/Domain of unknown function (DUF1905)